MSAAANLLDRLEGVKATASGRWIAKCPAHQDRSPSLSVREVEDGRMLVHCFAGCGALDVLDAVGLDWSALFPDRGYRGAPPSRSKIPARDLLEIINEESALVAIVGADFLARKAITEPDWQRMAQAVARIHRVRDHAYGR